LYAVADDGQLTLIRSLPTGQAANCWAVVTKDQRFAFTAAALALPSEVQGLPRLGSVTGFRFDLLDNITQLENTTAGIGPVGVPIDIALSRNDRFLYVLREADGIISAYGVGADGALTLLDGDNFKITNAPPSCDTIDNCPVPFPNGLIAR
jgi:6-phosphogluconolactonase (cycloisomerase 2 family)